MQMRQQGSGRKLESFPWDHQKQIGKMVEMWVKPLQTQFRIVLKALTVFLFMTSLFCDHGNFGKSTTSFSQTSVKTLITLRVNKHL